MFGSKREHRMDLSHRFVKRVSSKVLIMDQCDFF